MFYLKRICNVWSVLLAVAAQYLRPLRSEVSNPIRKQTAQHQQAPPLSHILCNLCLSTRHKTDEELAHIKEHVASIKDAISTLANLDTAGYAEELCDLKKELALAIIHQVKMMKQRTEQYKYHRVTDAACANFSHPLVSSAMIRRPPRSTPLSAFGSSDADATQYPPLEVTDEEDEPEHWIQYENPAQFDKLL